MSFYIANKLIDASALAVGTHRWKVAIGSLAELSFRWTVLQAAAAPNAAAITFYPSELAASDPALAELDPALNPYWTVDAAATFVGGLGGNPGTVLGSAWATLGANPWQTLLVQVVCTTLIPRFTLAYGGRTGGR